MAYQMPQTADVADMRKLLLRDLCRIARNICMFRVEHESVLSEPLLVALSDFAEDYERRFKRFLPDCESRFGQTPATGVLTNIVDVNEGIYGVLMLLGAFRAEFEFLSADNEAVARSLVVRSLTHLQRSIVADDTVRRRWKASFTAGETACEKLGACHLLGHGIWAFKASAEGERTDLVLGSRLEVTDDVRRAAEALALTEWKVVRHRKEFKQKAQDAFNQAKRYSQGILAGFELASRRYLILVSEDYLTLPDPITEVDAVYEYWNIAVSPHTPSARKAKASFH